MDYPYYISTFRLIFYCYRLLKRKRDLVFFFLYMYIHYLSISFLQLLPTKYIFTRRLNLLNRYPNTYVVMVTYHKNKRFPPKSYYCFCFLPFACSLLYIEFFSKIIGNAYAHTLGKRIGSSLL